MSSLSYKLDQYLLDLSWSLWTELGVAGNQAKHQDFLIMLEELIALTVVLAEIDPRLRDESLDWCSKYSHLISISRLISITKGLGQTFAKVFSNYAATLNHLSKTNWPVFLDDLPLKVSLSLKSCLRPRDSPALLNIRARSIFTTGARADIVTFFLTHKNIDFSASDLSEIGYSKRNLAEILDECSLGGLFDKIPFRNQQKYRLVKIKELVGALKPIPKYMIPWRSFIELVLPLRDCLKQTENCSVSTKVIEIHKFLSSLQPILYQLNLAPPKFENDFLTYWEVFQKWVIEIFSKLAKGDPKWNNVKK